MENKGSTVEFLCTGCGLQGLLVIESGPGEDEVACPRCGTKVKMPYFLEKASILFAI